MSNRRCSECNDRMATFKVNGRIKSDNEHDLCNQCFKSIMDSSRNIIQSVPSLSWDKRTNSFKLLKETGKLVVRTLNSADINSDLVCKLKITKDRAFVRFFDGNRELYRRIPDMSYNWNDTTASYLKHWFSKVLDDPHLNEYNRIVMNWEDSYESKT